MLVIKEMQNLRAFAILAVITIHTASSFTSITPITPLAASMLCIDALSHFAVPLFIFISGFVLAIKAYTLKEFYPKRARAILPAYVLFSVLYALYFHQPIIGSILSADASPHLPFFRVLIGLYLCYPLIIRLYDSTRGEFMLAASLLMQAYYTAIPVIQDFSSYVYFLNDIFYFVCGIYACRNRAVIQKQMEVLDGWKLIPMTMALGTLVILGWLYRFYGMQMFKPINSIALIGTGCYFLIIVACYKLAMNVRSPLMKKIGDYSFGIYLIHMFFLTESKNFLILRGIQQTNPFFYIATFLATLILSYSCVNIWNEFKDSWRPPQIKWHLN